jgi:hypothetical protein
MDRRLIDEFAPRFLRVAGLPASRLDEVPDTIEVMVADSWAPADGTQVLRVRSWYTGEVRWLWEWDGHTEEALSWVREVADLCGAWVLDERGLGGSTPWDTDA